VTGAELRESGIVFVISAPSGTGKSSLASKLVTDIEGLLFSVSYTTRPRRAGEQDGREYRFVDDATFDAMVAARAFIEWAQVYDRRYGTGREDTEKILAAGKDLLLDIDVQGGRQVRENRADAVSIFLLPPDYATLEARLRRRGSDSEEQVKHRLALAKKEAKEYRHYDYLVINDALDPAVVGVRSIVEAERRRVRRNDAVAERIIATFPAVP
jgi:guanylate kinase